MVPGGTSTRLVRPSVSRAGFRIAAAFGLANLKSCKAEMFDDVRQMESLRNGVDGISLPFYYSASPTVGGWAPNDIQAHIQPLKNAGAPGVAATMPTYWNAESNAYCSVGGSVSGDCAPFSGMLRPCGKLCSLCLARDEEGILA